MTEWLDAALAYAGRWMDYQVKAAEQPGCVVAVAKGGTVLWERAFGVADLRTGEALTVAHRFRVASHSKTFTAAGIMKLHEAGRLHLDDRIGIHVPGLHALVAEATIAQLLAHASGTMRDGNRSPHWQVRAPFFDEAALRAELARPLAIDANSRFKYSNLGFGLLGLAIEAITGEPYTRWITREVVGASELASTAPDMPLAAGTPLAMGHSGRMPFGRGTITGDQPTFALAAATGFVSTAGDLARFFASLDPAAGSSVLSVASRREMTRPHREVPHQSESRHYGLGTTIGRVDGHALVGHGGAFPGFISRSAMVPDWGIGLSVLTNAIDGPAHAWLDGIVSILHRFAGHGAPTPAVAGWAGRWWSLWRAIDLVPMGDLVLAADPAGLKPFADATEIEVTGPDRGRITLANGFASHGETVECGFDASGTAGCLFLGGSEWVADPKDLAVSYQKPL
jgi:CubicO group peptidase (beta-lactamase class C family)